MVKRSTHSGANNVTPQDSSHTQNAVLLSSTTDHKGNIVLNQVEEIVKIQVQGRPPAIQLLSGSSTAVEYANVHSHRQVTAAFVTVAHLLPVLLFTPFRKDHFTRRTPRSFNDVLQAVIQRVVVLTQRVQHLSTECALRVSLYVCAGEFS